MPRVRAIYSLLLFLPLLTQCDRTPPPPAVIVEAEPTVSSLISTFLDDGSSYRDIPFSEVIEASCRRQVIPVDPNDEVDDLLMDELSRVLNTTQKSLNQPDSPSGRQKRISGVTPIVEEKIRDLMDAAPGFSCTQPRTKAGTLERSGYPDLQIVHAESGRVTYLVTKLVEAGSLESGLQALQFTPRGEAGKVLQNAHHLLIGFEHDGKTGSWKFGKWNIVDLANSRVRLNAAFQASNKDIYQSNLIIKRSEKYP